MSVIGRLRVLVAYNPETGEFRRRRDGRLATRLRKDGYLWLSVDGRPILAHRAAWAITHWSWPEAGLDHHNLDRTDNRILNLRPASQTQNLANTLVKKNNKLGVKGVVRTRKGRFQAYIAPNRRTKYLGTFDTLEEAKSAHAAASAAAWGEFARVA